MKDKYNKDKGFYIKAGWYAEDSVVLTKEELKNMVNMANVQIKCITDIAINARKETAEKILNDLVGHTFEDDGWTWTVSKEDIQWLADKYGVKIKD